MSAAVAFSPGFLNLLGIKNDGRGFSQAGDAILPVADIEKWIASAKRELSQDAALALSAGTTQFGGAVPNGEVWIGRRAYAELATGGAATITGAHIVLARQQKVVGLTAALNLAVSSSGVLAVDLGDLLLLPGDVLGVRCVSVTGAPTIALASVLFDRVTGQ